MKKNKEAFIVFKKEDHSILIWPKREAAFQMDKFILGHKLAKKFPEHAQTIKVLSLMNLPFFLDPIVNKIRVIKEALDDGEEITEIWMKYFDAKQKGHSIPEVLEFKFKNFYKEDSEMLLPLIKKEEPVLEVVAQ